MFHLCICFDYFCDEGTLLLRRVPGEGPCASALALSLSSLLFVGFCWRSCCSFVVPGCCRVFFVAGSWRLLSVVRPVGPSGRVPSLACPLVLCCVCFCCCVVVVGCFCLASSFLPPPLPASLSLVLLLLCFACCPALLRRFAFGPRCPSCFVHRLPYGLSSHMHTARMHT